MNIRNQHKVSCRDRKQKAISSCDVRENKLICWGLFLGLISLVWLVLKTGRKPTRIQYPCQQTALANVGLLLIPPVAILLYRLKSWMMNLRTRKRIIRIGLVALVSTIVGSGVYVVWLADIKHQTEAYYKSLAKKGPFGKRAKATLAVAGSSMFLTLPHAMALQSPHRVVSVHNPDATSWTFSCTSTGVCTEYYGDDSFVDQVVVDEMVRQGVIALTGQGRLDDAWRAIIPGYAAGEVVAVKVNFNDTIAGGGTVGYGDNDAYVDALPQIVNSIIAGLKEIGVQEEDIWVFDVSRHITDRFRMRINYASVRYFDRYGNGDDVETAGFDSQNPSASIEFSDTQYNGDHRVADLLVEADYLINVPIMKRHGGAGITLGLKNHMGSINGFYTGGHAMHNYIYLESDDYDASSNPLVDINLNPHILNKTVLVVGDALYGCWSSNNTPPERWTSFNNDSPNMLFFGADPVAVDSVMFDYLDREGYVNPKSEDILILAANAGLGVHERWTNDADRYYNSIEYVELDDSGGSESGGGGGCFVRAAAGL